MYRPELSYIKLVVKKDEITAYSCDGYLAAKVTVPNLNLIDEEFECLIKPIAVKPSKGRPQDIIVEVVDGDKLSPFIIKAKCGETNNWQVVIPARGDVE